MYVAVCVHHRCLVVQQEEHNEATEGATQAPGSAAADVPAQAAPAPAACTPEQLPTGQPAAPACPTATTPPAVAEGGLAARGSPLPPPPAEAAPASAGDAGPSQVAGAVPVRSRLPLTLACRKAFRDPSSVSAEALQQLQPQVQASGRRGASGGDRSGRVNRASSSSRGRGRGRGAGPGATALQPPPSAREAQQSAQHHEPHALQPEGSGALGRRSSSLASAATGVLVEHAPGLPGGAEAALVDAMHAGPDQVASPRKRRKRQAQQGQQAQQEQQQKQVQEQEQDMECQPGRPSSDHEQLPSTAGADSIVLHITASIQAKAAEHAMQAKAAAEFVRSAYAAAQGLADGTAPGGEQSQQHVSAHGAVFDAAHAAWSRAVALCQQRPLDTDALAAAVKAAYAAEHTAGQLARQLLCSSQLTQMQSRQATAQPLPLSPGLRAGSHTAQAAAQPNSMASGLMRGVHALQAAAQPTPSALLQGWACA